MPYSQRGFPLLHCLEEHSSHPPDISYAPFQSFLLHSNYTICICFLKLKQTKWLKTTQIYCLIVLEATRPRSRCQHGHAPSADARERSVPGLSAGIWYFLGLRRHNSGLRWHPPCAHVCLRISPSCKDSYHAWSGSRPTPV